eukprot:2726482-Rhodomonas_salina.1
MVLREVQYRASVWCYGNSVLSERTGGVGGEGAHGRQPAGHVPYLLCYLPMLSAYAISYAISYDSCVCFVYLPMLCTLPATRSPVLRWRMLRPAHVQARGSPRPGLPLFMDVALPFMDALLPCMEATRPFMGAVRRLMGTMLRFSGAALPFAAAFMEGKQR